MYALKLLFLQIFIGALIYFLERAFQHDQGASYIDKPLEIAGLLKKQRPIEKGEKCVMEPNKRNYLCPVFRIHIL